VIRVKIEKSWNAKESPKRPVIGAKIATLVQSARCPVVSQPNLAALYSGVVGGADEKKRRVKIVKKIRDGRTRHQPQ